MRSLRTFSTTRFTSKQTLFQPYVAPLNQEQKKALRKKIMKSMPTFHGSLKRDAQWLLNTFAPSVQRSHEREQIHAKIRDIIRSSAGYDYEVEDISIRNYAIDVDLAPLELVIVDKKHPKGLPPGSDFAQLPVVYKPRQLSQLLITHGLDGGFRPQGVDRRQRVRMVDGRPHYVPEEFVPWPEYQPFERGFLYPATLHVQGPAEFKLTLPGPTISPTLKLLDTYGRMSPYIFNTISLLYIWIRSWGVHDFPPIVLAMMFVKFLQESYMFPTLSPTQKSPDSQGSSPELAENITWMPYHDYDQERGSVLLKSLPIDLSLDPKIYFKFDRRSGSVMYDFFKWFAEKNFHAAKERQILSIHTPNTLEPVRRDIYAWKNDQSVVQDPFVPTYNHAYTVSRSALYCLSSIAMSAGPALSKAKSLGSIYGLHITPPRLGAYWKERYIDTNVIFRSPHVYKFPQEPPKQRSYHTSAHLRKDVQRAPQVPVSPARVGAFRSRTLEKVTNIIKARYGAKYSVEGFGSTQYGVDSPGSDLDLVIIDPDRRNGFGPNVKLKALPAIYSINHLEKSLRQAGLQIILKIPKATVPIIRFRDPLTGITCDINVNDRLGIANTKLIKLYCDLLPVLRQVIMTIKMWAKEYGYNNTGVQGGTVTFSSYALTLMSIGLFQARGFLPHLQNVSKSDLNSYTDFFWLKQKGGVSTKCDVRWKECVDWKPPRDLSVDEAVMDWFRYWGRDHRYETDVMSIRHGGLVPRQEPFQKSGNKSTPTRGADSGDVSVQGEDSADTKITVESAITERTTIAVETEDFEPIVERDEVGFGLRSLETAEDAPRQLSEETDSQRLAPEEFAAQDILVDADQQSSLWARQALCVADPFIVTKNVAGAVGHKTIEKFRDDCMHAYILLGSERARKETKGRDGDQRKPQGEPRTQKNRTHGRNIEGADAAETKRPSQAPKGSSRRLSADD